MKDRQLIKHQMCADDVIITGIVSQQWKSCYVGSRCDISIALMANNITLDQSRKAAVEVCHNWHY